jgi:hypothetical protein
MPSVNVSEADFAAVAGAAKDAQEAGHHADAGALDKLARKINAALSNETARRASGWGPRLKGASWRNMPSTLEP